MQWASQGSFLLFQGTNADPVFGRLFIAHWPQCLPKWTSLHPDMEAKLRFTPNLNLIY